MIIVDQKGAITDADRARFRRALQPGQPLGDALRAALGEPTLIVSRTASYACPGCGHAPHEGKACAAVRNGDRCGCSAVGA